MSFILDALRRAETLRGNQPRQIANETALDNIAAPAPAAPPLRLILGLLAATIGIAVVLLQLWNRDEIGERSVSVDQAAPLRGISPDIPLVEVAAAAGREIRPLDAEAAPAPAARPYAPVPVTPAAVTPGTVSVSQEPLSASAAPSRSLTNIPAETTEQFPAYTDLLLSGRAQLPQFHLDIHVFAPEAGRRFVFVNNRKYREGDRLDEGGTVERITPAGVVLNHRGNRFELLPD